MPAISALGVRGRKTAMLVTMDNLVRPRLKINNRKIESTKSDTWKIGEENKSQIFYLNIIQIDENSNY